jgi:integrase
VGEALRLRLEDVDLHTSVLTVRGTKFGKSRLVLSAALENRAYSAVRTRLRFSGSSWLARALT